MGSGTDILSSPEFRETARNLESSLNRILEDDDVRVVMASVRDVANTTGMAARRVGEFIMSPKTDVLMNRGYQAIEYATEGPRLPNMIDDWTRFVNSGSMLSEQFTRGKFVEKMGMLPDVLANITRVGEDALRTAHEGSVQFNVKV